MRDVPATPPASHTGESSVGVPGTGVPGTGRETAIDRSGRLGRLLRAHPVSVLLSAQYVLLYVLPIVLTGAPSGPLVPIAFVSISVAALGEWLGARLGKNSTDGRQSPTGSVAPWMVWSLAGVVVGGFLLGALTGLGSYSNSGVGGQLDVSGAMADVSRFGQSALAAAVALLTLQFALGIAPRKSVIGLLAIIVSVGIFSIQSGFLYPLAATIFTVTVMGVLLGAIRTKWLMIALAAALLLGPALLGLRNEVRAQTDTAYASGSASELSFYERIRQDTALAQIPEAVPAEWLDLPPASLILRAGLIPKPLDDDRPPITIASEINVALGRDRLSSTTFTQPGNITYLSGYWVLALFYFVLGALLAWLATRFPKWLPVVAAAILLPTLVYVGGSYPSSVSAALQNAEYSLIILGLLVLSASASGRRNSKA